MSHRILRHLSDDAHHDDAHHDERRSPTDADSEGPTGFHLLFKPDEPLVDFIFVHVLHCNEVKPRMITDNSK